MKRQDGHDVRVHNARTRLLSCDVNGKGEKYG